MAQISPPPHMASLPSAPPPAYSQTQRRGQSPQAGYDGQGRPDEKDVLRSDTLTRKPVNSNPIALAESPAFGPDEKLGNSGATNTIKAPRWPFADDESDSTTSPHTPAIITTPPLDQLVARQSVIRKPLNVRDENSDEVLHKRIPSSATSVSTGEQLGDDEHLENHMPLQYHHENFDHVQMKALNNRASKMTIGTVASDASTGSDSLNRPDNLNAGRQSYNGGPLPRPDSGFSTASDVRGRANSTRNSPYLSPADRPHSQVRHSFSRSPETRPMSYVDLLNVPYPQQGPSAADGLVNVGLRSVVGTNASLLSTRKTLDMYRQNIKKTADLGIQYEFAVFMVSAAQEEGLQDDSTPDTASQKSGGSTRKDLLKEARNILQRLSDRSYPFAQYYLADGYASGLFANGQPDLERSFPLFLAASKHGHAEAMYRTALCYEYGWGCRVDAAKAVQFYQHAASKNHPGAMLRLGRACLKGDMGLVNRYREGIRWLKRGSEAADLQYNQAPYDLACLHETGYGADVFKDESYAAQLFTRAADLGHADAGFRLGEAYEYGQLDCPKDPALSIHFYTGAAEQGHARAQMALCAWYMVGVQNVLDKDESEAYEWARRAAQSGLPKAQYTLGYFTEMGIGCRRDPLEANVWYVRAADQGEERAKHRITAIHAAATGADPWTAASQKAGPGSLDGEKKKRFGIF